MRWPWQRDRRPATRTHPDVAPSPMGWAFLPPLQGVVGDAQEITRPRDFPLELTAWRDPSLSAPAMSHLVSTAAPAGVIDGDGDGRGFPTQRTASVPELPLPPLRPVPRRSVAPTRLTSADPAGMPLLHRQVIPGDHEPLVTPPDAAGPDAESPTNDAVDVPHADLPLAGPPPEPPTASPTTPDTDDAATEVLLPRPATTPTPTLGHDPAPAQGNDRLLPSRAVDHARTAAPRPRMELGEPLTAAPPTAIPARPAVRPAEPPTGASIQRSSAPAPVVDPPAAAGDYAPSDALPPHAAPAGLPGPAGPAVQHTTDGEALPAARIAGAPGTTAPPPSLPLSGLSGPRTSDDLRSFAVGFPPGTVVHRSGHDAGALQRAAAPGVLPVARASASPPAAGMLSEHHGSEPTPASPNTHIGEEPPPEPTWDGPAESAESGAHEGAGQEPTYPALTSPAPLRTAAASRNEPPLTAPVLTAPVLTAPAVQRLPQSAWLPATLRRPVPGRVGGARSGARPEPGAAPIVQAAQDLHLPATPAPAPGTRPNSLREVLLVSPSPSAPPRASDLPVLSRAALPLAPTAPGLPVQDTTGAPDSAIAMPTVQTAVPPVARDVQVAPPEPAGTAAGAGPGISPADGTASCGPEIEALAQRLLTPLLRRIRAELLVDRERRGLRTDTWR